ncbi:MAG: DegV family protein [Clostridia bacterium]|nr:DegV family protein [Clostridia bacterium]
MSVLLCDSNCELWFTRLRELNLDYISMPYLYNGEEYSYDLGEKTDFEKFYNAVRSGVVPKTMALNPENYKEILTPYFKAGKDVLYISFSHAMSGTFQQLDSALEELKAEFPDRKCTVFDTKSVCLGAGIQVEAAAELKNKGASDEEILAFLKDFTNKVAMYFVVDDLMHLKRGGRLSAGAAVAGTLLSLKPMLTCDSKGGLAVTEKIMGRKKAIRRLAEKVATELTGTEYSVYVVDADCKEDGDELASAITARRPEAKIVRQTVGPVIGSHCGPGTLGVIFIADKRPIALED